MKSVKHIIKSMKRKYRSNPYIPYFFGYKTEFFSFQNNPKDLDPSYETDLNLWDCFGMGKIGIIARFHRTDLVI